MNSTVIFLTKYIDCDPLTNKLPPISKKNMLSLIGLRLSITERIKKKRFDECFD